MPWKGRSRRGLYGDVIEELDGLDGQDSIAALESQGISENTLVIFTSDNGPWIRFQDTATHGKYGEARFLVGSALPFRDGKGSHVGRWRTSARCLLLARELSLPVGSVVSAPASTMDISADCAFALAGVETARRSRRLTAATFAPYFDEGAVWRRCAGVCDSSIQAGPTTQRLWRARVGPWKLHTRLYSQTGNDYGFEASRESPLLFNVEVDPPERINLAERHPDIVALI